MLERARPQHSQRPLAADADLDIITVAVYINRQAKMSDLTPRQTQILRLIQRFISDTGMPPTRAEIAHELGFRSANAAEEHLRSEEHTSELQSHSDLVC